MNVSKQAMLELADKLDTLASTLNVGKNAEVWVASSDHELIRKAAAALRASDPQADVRAALDKIAPAVENLARHQEQCDMDGVMVKVSRQALDEVLDAVNELALAAPPSVALESASAAFEPFAAFMSASSFDKLPDDVPLTSGSFMAHRQITVGQLRKLAAALTRPQPGDWHKDFQARTRALSRPHNTGE